MRDEEISATEKVGKAYALGILFVHGMGEQARGDTITQMGDAFTEWLRRWLGSERFRLFDATLRGRETVSARTVSPSTSGRANATVILGRRDEPAVPPQKWLLAESWWADAFRPAAFGELAWWAIGVGPWLIASQLAGLQARLWDPRRNPVGGMIDAIVVVTLFLAAAITAAAILPVFLALLLLSLLPIPGISSVMQGIAGGLAGSFGDLLVFVRSPIRFAAIAERVRDDVDWLSAQCDRIMLVAHSQGTAVAWHALRRTAQREATKGPAERMQVPVFLTFGQAFRKLKALHRLHTRVGGSRQLLFAALAFGSTASLFAAAIGTVAALGSLTAADGNLVAAVRADGLPFALVIVALAATGVVQMHLSGLAGANDAKAELLIREDLCEIRQGMPDLRWLDLWASADPAPNGPFFSRHVRGVESYRVRNLASTLFDHSVYWSNVTQFIGAVAFRAGSVVPNSPLGSEPLPGRLRQAARVRDRRVTALASARVGVAAAAIAAMIGLRAALPGMGAWLAEYLTWLPFAPKQPSLWPELLLGTLGSLMIAVVALGVWWLLLIGWNALIRADEARFFGRRPQVLSSGLERAWIVIAAAVPSAVVAGVVRGAGDWSAAIAFVGFGALGLLVVLRLMSTNEPRM